MPLQQKPQQKSLKTAVWWPSPPKPFTAWVDKFLNIDISPDTYHACRYPRLFYMWGHSYEFDEGDGWKKLDAICEKLAGHENIWYATNMEIYEYTEGYNRLVYSADGRRVYNPSLFTIWFDVDGVLYSIKSGETLVLD